MKKCGQCKNDFEKTHDNFHKKIIKQKNAIGELKTYIGFRSVCKKCHLIKVNEIRQNKRCKELNCSIEYYRENWKKQYSETRIKYKETIFMTQSKRNVVRKKINKGYKYISDIQYKKDCLLNISKAKQKFDYGDEMPTLKQVRKVNNDKKRDLITEAYISNSLGFKVGELPKELIETKRLLIKLKREIRL